MNYPSVFRPTVDSFAKSHLFPTHPAKRLEEGKIVNVPIMMGFNKEEGIITTGSLLANKDKEEMLL